MMKKVKRRAERRQDSMSKEKKRLSVKEAARLNMRAVRLYLQRFPQMLLSSVIETAWSAVTPYVNIYFSALVIDELMNARDTQRLRTLIMLTLLSAAGTALVSVLLKRWREIQRAGSWYKYEHIWAQKLMDMNYEKVDDTKTHELLSTIKQNQNGDDWGIIRVIGNLETLTNAVFTILGGISLTISLFTSRVPDSAGRYTILNNPLFIVLIAAVMLAVTFIAPALSNMAGSYRAINADTHNFANRLFGFFGWLGYKKNIAEDMRIYRQDKICEKYNVNKENTFCSKGIFAKYSWGPIGLFRAASAAVSVIFTGIVYAFVCIKAWAGAFGLGSVMQYISAITRVSQGVSSLFYTLGDMRNNASFLKLVFEFLDIPNNMYQGSLTVEKRSDRKYEVEFKNVSFKYPGSDNYALKNVNMKFEIGKRLAVVGMNGSGKSTFIKLLCRLYDPTEGEILLNGIDIRKYNYAEYMDIFSVVFQDFNLLALKLGENVASGTAYDEEHVDKCLKDAGFEENLAKMPTGLNTYLYKNFDNSGVNVSGGEAQKIAIARALYKDAPFIILDEPTAALDPVTEAEIYSKFNDIVGDKTAIYISHRLSSCKFCDEIIVFNDGAVVQQGTHNELVADENGKYYELWNAQAQYYTA